ncbi:MAG: DUF5718 family protein [Campylobacterota bacterium]|nr:DUF5718 family protein [Campylobacterota bacterium]
MEHFKNVIGLGVAGNFALHLEQAGELEDFKDVVTEDENGPKGLFPFYLPNFDNQLGVFPLSSDTLILPKEEANVQVEPEVGLLCDLKYENGKLSKIIPTHFGAYNDASIRKEGAKKISEKKNWGTASKGFSDTLIPIDRFESGGVMDSWHIASFLRRDGDIFRCGEDVALTGYSYFYQKLITWMENQINTQKDFGPLEPINEYLLTCKNPEQAIISIGATRYSVLGENSFVQANDEIIVILYDETISSPNQVLKHIKKDDFPDKGISILRQFAKDAS